MSRRHQLLASPRTRVARTVACCAVALALAGCGAGQVTQTDSQVAAIDGASADLGNIALRDVLVPYPEDLHGTYPAGSDVPLQMTIVNQNNTADTLLAATSPAARRVLVQGTTTIPAGFSVATTRDTEDGTTTPSATPTAAPPTPPAEPAITPTATPAATPPTTPTATPAATPLTTGPTTMPASPLDIGELRVVLVDIIRPLRPGQNVEIAFSFRNGGTVTMSVPMGPPVESERTPLEGGGH